MELWCGIGLGGPFHLAGLCVARSYLATDSTYTVFIYM